MSDASSPETARIPRAFRRPLLYGVSAAVALGVVVVAHEVMLPFVLALVIAYVLAPLVAWVEARRVPRGAAILLVYAVVLGSLGLFLRLTAPRVGQELAALRREAPAIMNEVRDVWIPRFEEKLRSVGLGQEDEPNAAPSNEPGHPHGPAFVVKTEPDGSYAVEVGSGVRVVNARNGYAVRSNEDREDKDANRTFVEAIGASLSYVQKNAVELVKFGRDLALGVSRAIFVFGITLMLAAYLIITREKILHFFTSLVRPRGRPDFQRLIARIDRGLSGVVRGQLVICLVNGALCAVGFAFIGVKFWPVLAIVATVFSLIPIFGSIVSAVPAVLLGLTQSVGTAFAVLVFIVGVHQLEANVLNPKIMGDSAKIHPVLVILSLLVGEHFFQAVGALLAVPAMSIAQSLFMHFREIVDRDDPEFAASGGAGAPSSCS